MAIAVREFQECEFGEEKVWTPEARKIAHTPYLYAILVICQVDKSWVCIGFFEKKDSELCQVKFWILFIQVIVRKILFVWIGPLQL